MAHDSVNVSPDVIGFMGQTIDGGNYGGYYGIVASLGSPYGNLAQSYTNFDHSFSNLGNYGSLSSLGHLSTDAHAIVESALKSALGLNTTTFSQVRSQIQADLARTHFSFVSATGTLPTTTQIQAMHEEVFARHGIPGSWIGSVVGLKQLVDLFMGVELNDPHCFPAHTPITLANHTTKPIEHIRPGDSVLSYDADGNLVSAKVVRLFENVCEEWVELTLHTTPLKPPTEPLGEARQRTRVGPEQSEGIAASENNPEEIQTLTANDNCRERLVA